MSAPTYEGTTPLISDRYLLTFTAGEDLSMGDIVEITADYASGGTAIADNSHKDTTIIGMAIKAAVSNVCDAIIW
jgi:hypothetical protein